MSNAKETAVENFLVSEVERRGGFTVKLNPQGYKGIPDRLVVLPGRIVFVELKRPKGGVIAKLQHWWNRRFCDLGHEACFASTPSQVLDVLDQRR